MTHLRLGAILLGLVLTSPVLLADDGDPLRNWAAPPYWTPVSASGAPSANLEVEKSSAIQPKAVTAGTPTPLPFVAITPCRLADTRSTSVFTGPYGPPSLPGVHTQRSFIITGQCAIPADAQAVSFNFAVWAPVTRGDLRVFPAGLATPTVATLNWEANIQALANAAVVPLGSGGDVTVQVDGPGTIDLIIDVNGYYSPLGVVSSVDAALPVVSSGGATPTISISKAGTSTDGYLSAADWTVFNSKGAGTVTSVTGSGGTTGLTLAGGPITGAGTLTLGGTLAVASGGTGAGSATGALNNLLPAQTGSGGNVLTTDGSNSSWAAAGETTWHHEFWGAVSLFGSNQNIESPVVSGVPIGTKVVVIVTVHASNDTFDAWGCMATLGSFNSPDRRLARQPTVGQSMVFSGTTSTSSSSFVLSCRNDGSSTARITSYSVRIVKAASATGF